MAGNIVVGRGAGAVWGAGTVGLGRDAVGAQAAMDMGVMGFVGHGLPNCGSVVGCRVSGLCCILPSVSLAVFS